MSSSEAALESGDFFLAQAALSFILATLAVLSNVLLLTTVYRDPNRNQRIWQTPSFSLLVVNLSVCDLLAGLVPGYGSLYYDISVFAGHKRSNLSDIRLALSIAAVSTNIVSSCTVAAMAFDRLFAVSSPLRYKARVTKAKITVFIVICWIYSLLFSSLPLMGVSRSLYVLLYCHLHVSVPLVILPVVYLKTFRALRLHNDTVRNTNDGRRRCMRTYVAHKNIERRLVFAFLVVLVSFYLLILPQYVSHNMVVLLSSSITEQDSFRFFLYTSNKIILVNCILNPFIYVWRIPYYRRAFKITFNRCVCHSENVENGSLEMQRAFDVNRIVLLAARPFHDTLKPERTEM